MSELKEFPPGVEEKIGNYVYRLIDPRNGETFYIGKGTKNRIFEHASVSKTFSPDINEDSISLKLAQIEEIKSSGMTVQYVIHRHDIPSEAVYEVESALIDAYSNLTNIQGGHGSSDRGPMTAYEICDKYALPEIDFEPEEKLVLININRLKEKSNPIEILRQTKLAWRISKEKAETADYVLAVVRGVVVGAFIAKEWLTATHENFPHDVPLGQEMPQRKGFEGSPASPEIWEKFVGSRGKRIAIDGMKHVQFPIRYWNI